jgi:hypothetical protein
MVFHETRLAIVGLGRIHLLSLDTMNELGLFAVFIICSMLTYIEVFRSILAEPSEKEPPFPALARTVHFFNSGRSILVGFLDSKEMYVSQSTSFLNWWSIVNSVWPGIFRLGRDSGDTNWKLECACIIHYIYCIHKNILS